MRVVAYHHILALQDDETVILTGADFDDSNWGWENWRAPEQLAVDRQWPLLTIALHCDAVEDGARIASEGRAGHGKLTDAEAVDIFARRRLIEGTGAGSLRLDITHLSADIAAGRLVDWVEQSVVGAARS